MPYCTESAKEHEYPHFKCPYCEIAKLRKRLATAQEKAAARPCAIIGNQVTVSFDTAEQAQRYYDSLRDGG